MNNKIDLNIQMLYRTFLLAQMCLYEKTMTYDMYPHVKYTFIGYNKDIRSIVEVEQDMDSGGIHDIKVSQERNIQRIYDIGGNVVDIVPCQWNWRLK